MRRHSGTLTGLTDICCGGVPFILIKLAQCQRKQDKHQNCGFILDASENRSKIQYSNDFMWFWLCLI